MAKVYTGRDGVMQLAGTTLAKVVNFSLSANLETLETTTLSESIRSYTPGISGYSGNKLYKTGTTGVSSSDTVELTFRWVDGADNNDIKLTAYITSANIGASTGEIVRAEIAFQGTGALSTVSIS